VRSFSVALLLACAVLVSALPASSADEYYAGKTLTIVINIATGGATGTEAQFFAQAWRKYIPGNPNVIVQPITGGALMKGMDYVLNTARPDGLTVGWFVWGGPMRAAGPPSEQFPFARFVPTVIGAAGHELVLYARKDVAPGLHAPADIAKAQGLKLGGIEATSTTDDLGRMSLDLIGVKHQYIPGYSGGADVNAALMRGEVNAHVTPSANYLARVKENTVDTGVGLPLWYFPFFDDRGRPIDDPIMSQAGVQTFAAVYRAVKHVNPSGPLWNAMKWVTAGGERLTYLVVAPPRTSEAQLRVLRQSFDRAAADPEFIAAIKKLDKSLSVYLDYKSATPIVQSVASADPRLLHLLNTYVAGAQ
jgi:tripartite-type tricarboxylate transporter receptor subunit TctC